jgi:hypothetical protein
MGNAKKEVSQKVASKILMDLLAFEPGVMSIRLSTIRKAFNQKNLGLVPKVATPSEAAWMLICL